jgi:hypothetical protein
VPKSRAQKLYEVGRKAFAAAAGIEDCCIDLDTHGMLAAMANMIAEATKPKKRAASGRTFEDKSRGQELYERLREEAPKAIAYSPVNTNTFSIVGKKLRDAGVTEAEETLLVNWLRSGPFDWRDSVPSWGEFVKKIIDWVALAKVSKKHDTVVSDALAQLREDDEL